MDIQQLKRLIDLLARSPIQELAIEEGGQSIRLTRQPAGAIIPAPAPLLAAPQAPAAPPPAPSSPAPAAEAPRIITAPTYGVFHLSPSPGTPPYVTVGQAVQAGQQVGLVEAMKVFNAVKATLSGQVAEILVEDGAEVEAGQPLFRLS
ncbi:acetyl-CoA carboxylase biotin carboxyl carrier protein [Gluconacetobacter asukensis]|uniref:Biotin carboxyl carrier protein of acetyl-CoA carboxylase n=1 Tax=Gluconacetobacter asukensis TaxID=1017181 RepID=A0A7W4IZ16_9PROT|nr:acetyl-CoA carboxylase biotin carboxyl carrier protein [Gluconacetobacter asukensis]